jgi:predicted nucleotidyltransferase
MEIDMRVTRETLLKLTKDIVQKRFVSDINVTAVFLVGSLRPEDAVVEGVADLDLLVICNGDLPTDREIVKLSNDFHLDIAYEAASLYAQPRELRGDPWRGWAMWDPCLLHQKGRFFEYTQSIIRSQFDDTLNLLKRARFFSVPAREAWYAMQLDPESATPLKLLDAVYNAANALVILNGAPIPERRLLADFPARAQSLEQDEMIQTLFASVAASVNAELIGQWLLAWEIAFQAAARSPLDARLHAARLGYYKSAITNQLESDLPTAALWPMLYTWALVSENGTFDADQTKAWGGVCAEMGLSAEALPERLQALDAFLDRLEEILEQIAVENGV